MLHVHNSGAAPSYLNKRKASTRQGCSFSTLHVAFGVTCKFFFSLSRKYSFLLREISHNPLRSFTGPATSPIYHLVSSTLMHSKQLHIHIYMRIYISRLMQLEESGSVSQFHIYRERIGEGSLFCYICFLSWTYSAFISLLSYTLILACLLAHNCLMTLKIACLIFCLVHRPVSLLLGLILNGMPWDTHQKWRRNK